MALPVPSTLLELRHRLAKRLGLGAQVEVNEALRDQLTEHLRSAFHYISDEAPFAALQVRRTIALTNAQHTYDIPDDILPGNIHRATILSDENYEYELHYGITPGQRSIDRIDSGGTTDTDNASLPVRWVVENGMLALYPAPDTSDYTHLVLYAKATPTEPREDNDRPQLDAEALLLAAEVTFNTLLRRPTQAAERNLRRRIDTLRGQEMPGETIEIGGPRSQRYEEGFYATGSTGIYYHSLVDRTLRYR